MSRRVAIRKAPPVAAAGAGAGAVAAANVVTNVVAGQAAKKVAKETARQTFTDKIKDAAAERIAGAPQDVGNKIAEQTKQSQQNMEQRGQQMADKAKAGSQITTGEAMDMSWRMLKDMYFTSPFRTPEYAQSRQRIIDTSIENMQNPNLFQPNQHGKVRAGFVEDIPKFDAQGKSNIRDMEGKTEYRDTADDWTSTRFNPDYMYDQEHSDPKSFPGMYNIPSHQLMNALEQHIDFTVLPKFNEEQGGSDRMRGAVKNLFESKRSGVGSKTTQQYQPLLQEMGLPGLTTVLEQDHDVDYEQMVNPKNVMRPNLDSKVSLLASNRLYNEKTREERERRYAEMLERRRKKEEEEEAQRQKDIEEKKSQAKQSMRDETKRKRTDTLAANRQAKEDAARMKDELAATEKTIVKDKFLDTDEGKEIAGKFDNLMGYPNMYTYNNKQISPQRIRTLPIMEQAVFNQLVARGILKSSPMDMAWRMLKGELQLPHQITEALRGDLTTLDRAHKMTDTNEGTLIEGIHPDMEQVVKLLAEKHMGDLTPTKQRPIMPLFYGPHH